MVKPYTQKFVDYVEVNIHVAGPLLEHGYMAKLSEDGVSLFCLAGNVGIVSGISPP